MLLNVLCIGDRYLCWHAEAGARWQPKPRSHIRRSSQVTFFPLLLFIYCFGAEVVYEVFCPKVSDCKSHFFQTRFFFKFQDNICCKDEFFLVLQFSGLKILCKFSGINILNNKKSGVNFFTKKIFFTNLWVIIHYQKKLNN